MGGPYVFDPAVPDGAIVNITELDDHVRDYMAVIDQSNREGWMSGWPANNLCTPGWPRLLLVTERTGLPAAQAPYGRIAHATAEDHLYVETADGWKNAYPAGTRKIYPAAGLTGDGFLATPSLCGTSLFDWFDHGYKGIFVGPDFPCDTDTVYRAFLRFRITPGPLNEIASVKLRLYLAERAAPPAAIFLQEINDFGTLDFGDFSIASRFIVFPPVALPDTPFGWVEIDVTARYFQAKTDALSYMAFRIQYDALVEFAGGGQAFWYGFVSVDDADVTKRPHLAITFNP